jgi:uncharacterized damage-inducible protein DinB
MNDIGGPGKNKTYRNITIMHDTTFGMQVLRELEAEVSASRKCLEVVPETLFSWKPHEKSMPMGYLALIVAEVPKWITMTIESSEIDFAEIKHFEPKTTAELVTHFDENLTVARNALQKVSDATLDEMFALKMKGKLLVSMPKKENISTMVNHQVHHRGQLTVYLRLNNIPVPSIYGPSADDRGGF